MADKNNPFADKDNLVNRVHNTSAKNRVNDFLNLLAGIQPGGIEMQEAEAAQQSRQSDTLPSRGLEYYREGAPYAALGFQIGERVENDELFTWAKLPEGWKKVASGHDMWTHIQDEKGRTRVAYFYKGAFYDRSATIHKPVCYYTTQADHDFAKVGHIRIVVYAATVPNNTAVYAVELAYDTQDRMAKYEAQDKATAECQDWLRQNYPDYENPMAYWD